MSYTNADGLLVITDGAQGEVNGSGLIVDNAKKYLVYDLADATTLTDAPNTPVANDPYIPSGSFVTGAWLLVETAFTSGGLATLDVGLQELDGTEIDDDGLDADIAVAALAANKGVVMDGALAASQTALMTADAYVSISYETAAFTAGAAKIVVEYITTGV